MQGTPLYAFHNGCCAVTTCTLCHHETQFAFQMKTHTRHFLVLIAVVAFSSCSLFAGEIPLIRIGSTQTEIHQAIGTPAAPSGDSPFKNPKQKIKVRAGFKKGVCNKICYSSVDHGRLEPKLIAGILLMNSNGVRWKRELHEKNLEFYHSIDGKYHARVLNGNEVLVVDDALFQKTDRSTP